MDTLKGNLNPYTKVPDYGLKVRLNHEYPENRSQGYKPKLRAFLDLLPLIIRYAIWYIWHKITGKSIIMDFVFPLRSKRIYGVPIGGIGAGTIGRGYRGEFCRFQMKPGLYQWETVDANQFIVTIKDEHQKTIFHSLLSCFPIKSLKSWESNIDSNKCNYTGLYPRSWTEYDLSEYGVKLICRQVTPIIPHNYKDSSLPCVIFDWTVENLSEKEKTVTIAFTFKNGIGHKKTDKSSTCYSQSFEFNDDQLNFEGVSLHHTIDQMPCSYSLSASSRPDQKISKCLYFDPSSDGSEPWVQLKSFGEFSKNSDVTEKIHGEMACGIAVKSLVSAENKTNVTMNLVWNMPLVKFPLNKKEHARWYTKYFGRDGVLQLISYSFKNYSSWERQIYDWQKKVLDDPGLPSWYKSALFNQTYFVSDGGSFWAILDDEELDTLSANDPRREYGRFAYLEGHEYKMFNTYDVHFYGSFSLHMNWPHLQKVIQYDFRDSFYAELPQKRIILSDGIKAERKSANSIPHDLGDPGESPFKLINAYNIHDVGNWKDLNSKFVLQVFRDAVLNKEGAVDLDFIKDMYGVCYLAMEELAKFDTDNDGLIENEGVPDQTYDTWIMTGPSSYCGSLWLAALFVMTKMASLLEKPEDQEKFENLLNKGKKSFDEKLWNGLYYNFDCSDTQKLSIMSDQLCGQWYLRSCGFNYEVFPREKVSLALKTIYKNNVQSFCDGNVGAVNGFLDGKGNEYTLQSFEIWTGVNYALSSFMIMEGMINEGFKTSEGMYNCMTYNCGLSFDTPEAMYDKFYYRSVSYMRPLSIWAIQLAWSKTLENKKK